jgi:hypothetical protein
MKAFDNILDRRLLPIRNITAQVDSRPAILGQKPKIVVVFLFPAFCARLSHGVLTFIVLQANQAHSVAFILQICSKELTICSEPTLYIADACTAMEMSDSSIGSSASYRGAPVRTDAIVRLRTACLRVLVAAVDWQAFR